MCLGTEDSESEVGMVQQHLLVLKSRREVASVNQNKGKLVDLGGLGKDLLKIR